LSRGVGSPKLGGDSHGAQIEREKQIMQSIANSAASKPSAQGEAS